MYMSAYHLTQILIISSPNYYLWCCHYKYFLLLSITSVRVLTGSSSSLYVFDGWVACDSRVMKAETYLIIKDTLALLAIEYNMRLVRQVC
jgi:hypothetical protein